MIYRGVMLKKICCKVPGQSHFYEIMPLLTYSTANLPPLPVLKKVQVSFPKTPSIFPKFPITQILNVLRCPTIPVAFYGNFASIWSKNNLTFSRVNKLARMA